jgi:hypothetical protein
LGLSSQPKTRERDSEQGRKDAEFD